MLVSFTASNFRSFSDEVTLDLRTPRSAASGARPWDGRVQAVAGIYGANASGKTTLFLAMNSMVDQVRDSYRLGVVKADPFLFDPVSSERPTEFAATFIAADGLCYSYGFSVTDGEVVEEWAQRYTTARPTLLFERNGSAVKFGTALKGPNRAVAKTMRSTTLYLSAAAAGGHEGLTPVLDWFENRLHTYKSSGPQWLLPLVVRSIAADDDLRDRLVTMATHSDLGFQDLELDIHVLTEEEKNKFKKMTDTLQMMTGQDASNEAPHEIIQALATHRADGITYRLPLELESDGTRAFLSHAFLIDKALRTGVTLVVDEIDANLHPHLVRELVRTFQDPTKNPRQAQLIFTTHDVSLMEAGYGEGSQLNRDEVWLTQKDAAGRSTLVALAEYSPRPRENLARRYLSGRFGAIPDHADLVDVTPG
jgi:AAA15 family ATPase/GTPase